MGSRVKSISISFSVSCIAISPFDILSPPLWWCFGRAPMKKFSINKEKCQKVLKKYDFTATEALKVLEYVESTVECAGQNAKLSQLIGE